MKKIKLLFAAMLSMMAWTGAMADDPDASLYEAAKTAVTDGNYRITTEVSGTKYYVTESGGLTSTKAEGFIFAISQTSGGNFGTGFRIDTGSKRFTNPPLNGSVANLTSGVFATTTGDRADWERQIFYKNDDGKFAIRSCNTSFGTSSWADAGRTFWTYGINPVTPQYSYDPAFVWNFEEVLATIKVTYELYEGETKVTSTTVVQDANSEVAIPSSLRGMDFNGFFHEKFYYDYAASGTIGDVDCTITVTRTEKAGLVKALADLSNTKAYYIGCDRGAMIAYNGKMVNTALNDATANAQPLGKFAILNYEDNYYIFSVDENKFIKNDASVALDLTEVGFSTKDAMVMSPTTEPYFLWHFNEDGKYLNTNGNAPLGYVINSWNTADQGNQYYMVEAADFDPTAALAELEAYFHPSYFVTYVVKDTEGNTIFTSDAQPTKLGAKITTLLDEFKRTYYTYDDVDVTISEQETTAEFTATWDGPFEISADFDHAHWYNMAMRGTWYVTSDAKDANDGDAYVTQNANTMGLVEEAYQWAFLGNGYEGFKIINKAEGDGKSFGYTDAAKTNAGIPTVMDDSEGNHAWNIVPSTNTSVPTGSVCLNVPGTNLYINQYGGAGGKVKFWDSTSNISDPGSAFTIFDVPTNFAEFVVDEIAPALDATGYFAFKDEVKAAIGYDESMKTECSFADYKAMKEALAEALEDASNFILPETGYYTLKNKNYGTYFGIDPSDLTLWGNYTTANQAKNIVLLIKGDDNTYKISLEGVYAPATVEMSQPVLAAEDAGTYTAVIPAVGYVAFQADPEAQYSALHQRAENDIVGWEATAAASQWIVEDATSIDLAIGEAGFATTCLPFAVAIPDGVTAYTGALNNKADHLVLNEVEGIIPAETAVVLEADAKTYKFEIAGDVDEIQGNDLKGTLIATSVENALTLQTIDGALGFYTLAAKEEGGVPTVPANKAYLEGAAGVKVFFGDVATRIKNVQLAGENTIFNLAGQRVNNAQKGIYIVNGQKLVK